MRRTVFSSNVFRRTFFFLIWRGAQFFATSLVCRPVFSFVLWSVAQFYILLVSTHSRS